MAARKVDRDFFDRKKAARPGFLKVGQKDFRPRSRRANCGEKGPWAETRKNPCASKADRLAREAKDKEKGKKTGLSAGSFFFVNEGGVDSSPTSFPAYFEGEGGQEALGRLGAGHPEGGRQCPAPWSASPRWPARMGPPLGERGRGRAALGPRPAYDDEAGPDGNRSSFPMRPRGSRV